MICEGSPGFVFHHSYGFEAGGDQELKIHSLAIYPVAKGKKCEQATPCDLVSWDWHLPNK